MEVFWLKRAHDNLQVIFDFYDERDPAYADWLAGRLYEASTWLAGMPRLGRKGQTPGTRELFVADTYCHIRYRIKPNRIEVLRVIDGRTDWKKVKRKT